MLEFAPGLKVGQVVKTGEDIGKVGNVNGQIAAHLHFEVTKRKPATWRSYIWGWSKEKILDLYEDPAAYIDRTKQIPARYETFGGYEFLDAIVENGVVKGYHPGVDINWGSGNMDLGSRIVAPRWCEIVYIDETKTGWGKHVWARMLEDKEIAEVMAGNQPATVSGDPAFGLKMAGKILLAVEDHGKLFYVDQEGVRHSLSGTPEEVVQKLGKLAIGISNTNLNKIHNA